MLGTILLGLIALGLTLTLAMREPARLRPIAAQILVQLRPMVLSVPLGLFLAACVAQILPSAAIASTIGAESGLWGVLIASLVGGFIPGGPMVTYPIAIGLIGLGAGQPQMIALLTAWSIFAVHRILGFELPLLGPRFVRLRLIASAPLPFAAGLIAGLVPLIFN